MNLLGQSNGESNHDDSIRQWRRRWRRDRTEPSDPSQQRHAPLVQLLDLDATLGVGEIVAWKMGTRVSFFDFGSRSCLSGVEDGGAWTQHTCDQDNHEERLNDAGRDVGEELTGSTPSHLMQASMVSDTRLSSGRNRKKKRKVGVKIIYLPRSTQSPSQ